MKILVCEKCGNMVELLQKGTCPVKCCGEPLVELAPNTVDASAEKHVPVVEKDGNVVRVKVGAAAHPMVEAHYIGWIALETKEGLQRKYLKAGDAPEATFALAEGDEAVAAYDYCNLHGLWTAEIN